ncbi:MAG: triose-phosphate isomerase [Candidatus Nanopusillus sp.]|jgi:triosephosphate isomerase|nr:triose-phosphate isomerase [Candidatus Nanopusillus sp.]
MLVINLKSYIETIGKRGLELLEAAEKVAEEYDIDIAIAPQFTDIYLLSKNAKKVKIFAQHIDPIEPGAYTGHILPEAVKEAGAVGTLINHSEKPMKIIDIEKAINIAKRLGLITVVCANDNIVGAAIAKFNPNYVAVEPPELIGTGISVSTARPEIVINSVKMIKEINSNIKVLVGAGISNREDVKKALEFGAEGVLLSSAVTKANNFYEKIKELAEGFIR